MARQARCSRIELPGVRPIIVAPSHAQCSGRPSGFLCWIPAATEVLPLDDPLSLPARPSGRWQDPEAARERPGAPRPTRSGSPRTSRARSCSRMRKAVPGLGASSRRPARPERAPSRRSTRTIAPARVEKGVVPPAGASPRSRGGRIAEECYLVDPASSHMLVSKIKPCMCKYELIQTVKLRMAH